MVSPAHSGLQTSATATARPLAWKLCGRCPEQLLLFLLITLPLLISDSVAASMGSSVIALCSKQLKRVELHDSCRGLSITMQPSFFLTNERPLGHKVIGMRHRLA